jgi:hypothetical protein
MHIPNKEKIKKYIYGSMYNSLIATDKYYNSIGKIYAALKVHKAHKEWQTIDKPKLSELRNIHANKRKGYILCNGPSLNLLDLSRLKDEITIGVNAIYLNQEKMGFLPTYYIVEDDLVGEDRKDELNGLAGTKKLIAQRLAYCLKRDQETIYLNHCPDLTPWPENIAPWLSYQRRYFDMDMPFSEDASIATFGGYTVTYTSLQIAYHLGLREVYIIGADHNYKVPEKYSALDSNENFIIEPTEDDLNHFNKDYFGKGYRWHNPKIHKLEIAYDNAKKFFEGRGGKIFNATLGGNLEVFERVNFEDTFNSDFVNLANQNYKNEFFNHSDFQPYNYNGQYIQFSGENSSTYKFKYVSHSSYNIEFMLMSEVTTPNHVMSDISPPMPLIIHPYLFYQQSNNSIRIRLSDEIDITINNFFNYRWHKIRIEADKYVPNTRIFFNDVLIVNENTYVPLGDNITVGKGIKNRFWKGKIGYICIKEINNNIENKVIFNLST